MKVIVTLEVDVNVDDWQAEFHLNTSAEALKDVLQDLRKSDHYLAGSKWAGLVEVKRAKAHIQL